ncbi:CCA tRNA nucleotidyltransferase [Paracrocinitomix mangrovi]|uniref:CCA tRNA nucleotidyltransferase n=1 Tax=Paracrocinitomix mangrovi TaxID=2862509 RepID=UPI001C8E5022|nr:HD domain-containing protein [Paracrocinitomix mangrovi]UKN03100.1 CCA tRNA nucleotidyltransferase [Paracrocinitomix mangrovi]
MNLKEHLKHKIFHAISDVATERGTSVFVIGGYVRDLLLKRPSKDIDFVVLGNGLEFAAAVAEKLAIQKVAYYKNFGTAAFVFDDLEIEFVGARKESYSRDSRKPIVENGTLQDDQNRRDFTINALAISLNKSSFGEVLDPFNGLEDLENKIIRTPLEPDQTYSDDPLRMMRAIRFATQLNFKIEQSSLESIEKNAKRLEIISMERIITEFNKIVLADKPSIGISLLFDTKLLHQFFPEMVALQGVDTKNGLSHKDNFYHTLEVLDNICENTDDLWLRWSAIMHDIAKPKTKRFNDKVGWTFHGHEDLGAKMTPKIFKRLKLPMDAKMKYVQKLVRLHLRPIALVSGSVTDTAIRRLLFEAGDDIDDLMTLCNADITSKNEYKVQKYRANFEKVRTKLTEVEEKDQIRNFQPPISGSEIMNIFQLEPSKVVGELKNEIKEAILEGKIKNNYNEAYELLISLADDKGLKIPNRSK